MLVLYLLALKQLGGYFSLDLKLGRDANKINKWWLTDKLNACQWKLFTNRSIYFCSEKPCSALLDRDLRLLLPSPHTHFLVLGKVRPPSHIFICLSISVGVPYLVHYLGEGGWDAKTPNEVYTNCPVGPAWDQTGGHFICFCHHVKFDPSLVLTSPQRFCVCTVCSCPVYQ